MKTATTITMALLGLSLGLYAQNPDIPVADEAQDLPIFSFDVTIDDGGDAEIEEIEVRMDPSPGGAPIAPPVQIPFGKLAQIWAVSQVREFDITAYSGEDLLAWNRKDIEPLQGVITDLNNQIGTEELLMRVRDFSLPVMIQADLSDEEGRNLLRSNNQFNWSLTGHNEFGVPEYVYPANALRLNFYFVYGIKFRIPGVTGATIYDDDGEGWGLNVNDGVIELPDWAVNSPRYYPTIQLHFADGQSYRYGESGRLMMPNNYRFDMEVGSVAGFEKCEPVNGLVYHPYFDFLNNYNPTLEITITEKEWVTFDVHDWRHGIYGRPDAMFVTRVQDVGHGQLTMPYNYDLKTDGGITQQIQVPLEPGTYQIFFVWNHDWFTGKG